MGLECYCPTALELCGLSIAAAFLTYELLETPVKRQAATVLVEKQDSRHRKRLDRVFMSDSRRSAYPPSGIVLAGGAPAGWEPRRWHRC